jgi:beta-propeller repeat-containing protein
MNGLAAPPVSQAPAEARRAHVRDSYGKLPLYFEANVGQTDAQVDFLARGAGYTLFLTPTEALMALHRSGVRGQGSGVRGQESGVRGQESGVRGQRSGEREPGAVVRMQIVGGNPASPASGLDQLPGKVNYFLGNDPSQWHTNIPTFGRVEYQDVYPGIDLVYYGQGQQLEYDFVVAPGADPRQIRLGFAGADAVDIDAQGDLVLRTGDFELRQQQPYIYQEFNGIRQEVAGNFVLSPATDRCSLPTAYCLLPNVYFQLGPYDSTRPLVIDPVVLRYSTYLGGSAGDYAYALAVDDAGSAYVTGRTYSTNFPLENPFQSTNKGAGDAFVAKLNAAGSALVYATYLGGTFGCSQGTDGGEGTPGRRSFTRRSWVEITPIRVTASRRTRRATPM